MIKDKRVVVVMPAYNAETTLRRTYAEIPHDIVDEVVLVDDASQDHTVRVANELNLHTVVHRQNRGYGGNQKTCYKTALSLEADIVIMLHPDYQYTPLLITAMASLLAEDVFDCVLGSRILGVGALRGGMPLYKYVSNRFLTAVQNLIIHYKLSEYHTGYRGFTRQVLQSIPYEVNSDNFVLVIRYSHEGTK
jgi:glycosyltransferase involved in cell wall biosynthesis